MELSFDAQRAYCQKLGIIPAEGEAGSAGARIKAWWDNPQAQEVSRLLGQMETHWRAMQANAKWIRGNLDDNDRYMEPDEVHTFGRTSNGVARYAIEYDAALAAYCALETHLTAVVIGILRDRGYELDNFHRLEDIPAISPEEDQARHALAKLERHLKDQAAYSRASQRRHLREHGLKVTAGTVPDEGAAHAGAHADELAAARAAVAAFETEGTR